MPVLFLSSYHFSLSNSWIPTFMSVIFSHNCWCFTQRPNTSWAAELKFTECWMRVPLKQKLFYKSHTVQLSMDWVAGSRQLSGNSSVSAEVIPEQVMWSDAARSEGSQEKSRKGKNMIVLVIKTSYFQPRPDTSLFTVGCNALQCHSP